MTSKLHSRFAASIALVAGCVGAFWIGTHDREPPPSILEVNSLTAISKNLALGEVWEQKDFAYDLPIRNPSKSEVQVVDVRTSCGCTDVEPRRMRIPAEADATLRVGIDLFHRDRSEIGQALRPFAVEVTPITNQLGTGKSGWRLAGVIRSRVTLDVLNIHFGEEAIHAQKPAVRRVLATAHVPLRDLQVELAPPIGQATVVSRTENRFVIEIAVSPALNIGPFSGEMIVTGVDQEGTPRRAAILPIAGVMQPEIRMLPASVTLTPQPVGTVAEATLVLQAPESAEPVVHQVETSTSDLSVVAVEVPGIPKGRAFRISQRVTAFGDMMSGAVFVVRVGQNPEQRVKVDIRVHGTD